MNNKRIFLVVVGLGLVLTLRAGMMYYMVNSVSAQLEVLDKQKEVKRQPTFEFSKGFYYSDYYSEKDKNAPTFGRQWLITDSPYMRNDGATREEVVKEVKKHLPKNYADFASKLPRAVLAELDAADISRPEFEVPAYDVPMPNLKEYRHTSRFWGDLGRLMLDEGKENSALALAAGILLLSHNLDRSPETGALILSRMISIAIRNIGNSLLLEQANQTQMSAKQIKGWILRFQKLRQGLLPLSDAYKTEAKFYEIAGKFLVANGYYSGRILLNNKKAFDKFAEKTTDKLMEVDKLPYSKQSAVYDEVATHFDGLFEDLKIGPSLIMNVLLSPSKMIVKNFGFNFFPNFNRAYQSQAKTEQLADGAIAVLIIKAYEAENKAFPESLQQVEDWYGEKLPRDIFADMAPLQFNKEGPKQLFSVGPDMTPNTDDDLVFMPLQQK